MAWKAGCAVLAMLAMAGCVDGAGETRAPESQARPMSVGLVDCEHLSTLFHYVTAIVQQEVPPEYDVQATGSPATSFVSLQILDCRGVVLSNTSVLGQTRIAWTFVRVSEPPGKATPAPDVFAFEVFVDSQPLLDVLRAHNVSANLGTIALDNPTARLTAANQEYVVETLAGEGVAPPGPYAIAFHDAANAPRMAFTYNATASLGAQIAHRAQLSADGGILGRLPPSSIAPHTGEAYWGTSSGRLDFET